MSSLLDRWTDLLLANYGAQELVLRARLNILRHELAVKFRFIMGASSARHLFASTPHRYGGMLSDDKLIDRYGEEICDDKLIDHKQTFLLSHMIGIMH
jgi:hypothetical protein